MGFFTQILFGNDGKVSGKGTTDYIHLDNAEQAFHIAVASAIDKPEVSKIIALVFDEEGIIKFRRVWRRGERTA